MSFKHESPRRKRFSRLDRLAERETVIQYDDASDEARLFTRHRGLAGSIMKRGILPTREDRRGGKGASWWFTVPKSWVRVRPPRKVRKTQEQKRAELERLASLRKAPVSGGNHDKLSPAEG